MRYLYILLASFGVLLSTVKARSQSFTVMDDSLWISTTLAAMTGTSNINNNTSSPLNMQWRIAATNFPAEWLSTNSTVCDAINCYSLPDLWPSSAVKISSFTTGSNQLNMNVDFGGSWGCYFIRVRMNNAAVPTDTAYQTFMFCRNHAAGVQQLSSVGDVVLYPNPAKDELNLLYDAQARIKTIAVYDVIGKMKAIYETASDKSAHLNLASVAPGIYFVRLMNAEGAVVATRKFTKQ